MSRAVLLPILIASCGLVSCATVSKIGQGSVALVQKTSAATSTKVSQLADLVHPPGVKVVEVREKDLKPILTGQERALAFQNTRKRGFWFFGGPVDFKEPTLPEAGGEMDASLLPPLTP